MIVDQKKIRVFREAFRGREDVVAGYWQSKDGKRSGYSPLCRNEWVEGICKKPCRTCETPDYIPLSDDLIIEHLTGKRVLGVYPLLVDGSCGFVAVDFDDHPGAADSGVVDPLGDVSKFYEVCAVNDLPAYVLKSKSGKGFHAYLFFVGMAPAWKARAVTRALLEEADVIEASYDRIFPSQDEPSGRGLGNLIALPFQGEAAKRGYTVLMNPLSGFEEPFGREAQFFVLNTLERVVEDELDGLIARWDLKKQPKREYSGSGTGPLADYDTMLKECGFLRHCRDDAENLSYQHWWAMISNVVRCRDGPNKVHELSEPYRNYNAGETDLQISHAQAFPHPVTCGYIQREITAKYCRDCAHQDKPGGSPAGYGFKKKGD